MGSKREGICRLCGQYKQLSFEHIPPESAFNDKQQLLTTIKSQIEGYPYRRFRKGMGEYTLCERCNKETGGWYGPKFVEWTQQGMEYLSKVPTGISLELRFHICPLNILKQIMMMMLAMSSERVVGYHEELRKFVRNKESKDLPPKYKVYVYFNLDGKPRFESDIAVMKVDVGIHNYVNAEVALPPFGYSVLESRIGSKTLADVESLYDITWFSNYSYDEETDISLKLPALPTNTPFPLDYRSELEITQS